MMECPYCTHTKSRVTDKRSSSDGTRRRRECLKCKKRFTTHEKIEKSDLYVIKKDGRREKFDIRKLEAGIEKAFEKLSVPQKEIKEMINKIEEQIRKSGKKEVRSSVIGEIVMKKLKKIDDIAYIRFASVYRQFKDINEFKKEMRGL